MSYLEITKIIYFVPRNHAAFKRIFSAYEERIFVKMAFHKFRVKFLKNVIYLKKIFMVLVPLKVDCINVTYYISTSKI